MKVIQVANRKGGVGKTTTVVNVAWELVQKGKKVLVVDMDSQANTTSLLLDVDTPQWLGDILKNHRSDIKDAIYPALLNGEVVDGLFIIPGRPGDEMTRLDMEMISLTKREERLSLQLKKIANDFDYTIIDTSPGTSVLGLNAVIAADSYIIPTTYRDMSFEGIDTFLTHVSDVKFIDEDDIDYTILRTCLKRAAKRELAYGDKRLMAWEGHVAKTVIWDRAVFGDAELSKLPVSKYAAGHEASAYYKDFVRELLQ